MIIFCEGSQKLDLQKRASDLIDNAIASQGTSKNIQKMVDKLLD